MEPTTVVFDVGNVLFHWDRRWLYEKLIDDEEELEWFLDTVVPLDWHVQHDAGRDFADTVEDRVALFPHYEQAIRAYGSRFRETIGSALSGVHEIVDRLDARGVPLFAITNFSHEFFPPFRDEHPGLFDRFRDIVVSGEVQLIKPDPAIFRLAREKFGLRAGEAIFVDDTAANIGPAEDEGFIGHHFRDAERLEAELSTRGLL